MADSRNTTILLTGAIATVFLMSFLASASIAGTRIGSSSSQSDGPNQLGATNTSAAVPTDPRIASLTQAITRLADPKATAADKASSLTSTSNSLLELKKGLATNTKLTQEKKTEYGTKIDEALTLVNQASAAAKAGNGGAQSAEIMKKLLAKLDELPDKDRKAIYGIETGGAAAAVAFAIAAVNANGNGAAGGIYPYSHTRPINPTASNPAQRGFDCSGFVGWVLSSVGVITLTNGQVDTQLLYDKAEAGKEITSVRKGKLSYSDAQNMYKSGELKPGDILLSGMYKGQRVEGVSHVVLFLGEVDGKLMVAESQDRDGKHGVHFTTLETRLSGGRAGVSLLARPNYAG